MPWADKQAVLIVPTRQDPPAAVVRGWVDTALVAVPAFVRMRAMLVTAELMSDALRYASAPYVLRLSIRDAHRTLLVAVDDSSPELGSAWSRRSALVLVGGLSKRWGVDRRVRGKTVWAELPFDTATADLALPDQPTPSTRPARRREP